MWRGRIGRVVFALCVAVSCSATAAAAAPVGPDRPAPTAVARSVAQADGGLRFATATTYRLEPESGAVRVTVDASLTNTLQSRRVGDYIETPYFDQFAVAALGPVAEVRASRDGRTLSTSVEDREAGAQLVRVALSPHLVYGAPQDLRIEYTLPGQPSRSESATRINDAFASWFAVGVGDPGEVDITIDVPDRFDMQFTDIEARPERSGGRAVYRFQDLDEDAAFFGVSARDDSRLVSRSAEVGDNRIEILAWPGDEAWADFVADTVEDGLPAIEALTGFDLADDRDLTVAESATPYLYGYGGWFFEGSDSIEIGDRFDVQIVLHELTHLWFNSQLFDSRWISEGLADTVSNAVTAELGAEAVAVVPVDPAAPGAQPLNEWEVPDPGDDAAAIEEFGYHASHAVIDALVADLGHPDLRTLLGHAETDRIAWVGDAEPETTPRRDWRYLYDLAEEMLGSDVVADLFDAHVLTDAERPEIAEREAASERYERLADRGGRWAPPLGVRWDMADWDFDAATESIDGAERALDARDAIRSTLDGSGIDEPEALESRYEETREPGHIARRFADLQGGAERLVASEAAVDDAGPLERIGFLGSDIDDHRSAARAAFAADQLGQMDDELRLVDDRLDSATVGGLARIGGVLVVVLVVVVMVRTRRRRNGD